MSVNSVALSGNLTRDPDLRSTAGGTAVLSLGLAVNGRAKNQRTGDWEDRADFVDLVMFGARAEAVAQYLSKGSKVAVSGRLRYSSWEKDGQKRSKLEVVVDEIEIMSGRREQSPAPYAPPAGAKPMPAAMQAEVDAAFRGAGAYPGVYDEDIPF